MNDIEKLYELSEKESTITYPYDHIIEETQDSKY